MSADLELARRAALAAAPVLLSYYGRTPEGLDSKTSVTDPVSDADREAERVVRELLAAERPNDGLLAEEGSRSQADSGRRWVVDPLDGTVNFLYGFPFWAVSVALEDAEGMAVGVVLNPVSGECFAAERGAGATLDGKPMRVSGCTELAQAMIGTGFSYEPRERGAQADVLHRLLPRARDIRRPGAAALDLAYVAAGRLDAYYERGVKRWDWAAGRRLVEEAGGVVAEMPGEPAGLMAAATPELLEALSPLVC